MIKFDLNNKLKLKMNKYQFKTHQNKVIQINLRKISQDRKINNLIN